ncbi:ArsR family transcriptional regulator [Bacillus manliponensis]|uniref:ArsR family transcriptional regulator n=1 Tax=Bacillus manliponensis TaxID=574376 RepID=A0A073JSP1_9BACI|nr:metalloregulator ArsR/SmtB family transcription factor [Bacillus manliponensis]KEK17272.1 ArsR family transcriptional regulator [Bacillus manliponensis]
MTTYLNPTTLNATTESIISEEDVELLKAMAHPIRLRIIKELCKQQSFNVTQLTEMLNLPQSTVSQHLAKMRGKIVKAERKGIEMYYYVANLNASKIIKILGYLD